MNTYKKLFTILTGIAIIITAFAIQSCDIKSPVEGVTVRIKNIPRTTTVRVEFIDQNVGQLVTSPLNVSFGGLDAAKVISTTNEPLASTSTSIGILNFAIADDVTPSATNPVEFVVVVKSNNYLATSKRIIVTKPGANGFTVNMVNLNTNIPGVTSNAVSNAGSTNSTTGTSAAIVASSSTSSSAVSARVTVPSGTILRDANGNALSGTVATRVTYFDATEPASLASFPGGFAIRDVDNNVGNFVSAGFAAIDMSVNGVEVESFSKNVDVQLDINPNTINPETGVKIKAGDQLPLWSYDEDTGSWKNEGTYTVTASNGPDRKLTIRKTDMTHLSWWNMDWFYDGCYSTNVKIAVDGGCWQWLYLVVEFQTPQPDVQWGYLYNGYVYSYDPVLNLMNVPDNRPVTIRAFQGWNDYYNYYYNGVDNNVGVLNVDDLCQTQDITYTLQAATNQTGDNIDVFIRGVCPNGNVLDEGTLDVEIFKNGYWQLAGRIVDGFIRLNCLQIGQEYQFRVYYDGEYYTESYTITSTTENIDIELPGDNEFCE